MDILDQYKKQYPESQPTPKNLYEGQPQDYGPIIKWVIKISGGRIRDAQQANMILLGGTIVLIVIALAISFGLPGSSAPPVPLLRSAHPSLPIK